MLKNPINDFLTCNQYTFDKVDLIQYPDWNGGFCALLTYALNGVRRAIQNNRLPIINYDETATQFFYDPAYGDNVWEYYFEPPILGRSYSALQQLMDSEQFPPYLVHTYEPSLVLDWHHRDRDRIATFWAHDVPEDPSAWMAKKRALGREYVAKYVRVKQPILSKVDAFYHDHIQPQYTFGVHIRGTDFAYAEPTAPETYFRAIDDLVSQKGCPDFKIFLATDQTQYVDLFRDQYGERLITYDSLRSDSDVAPFKFANVSPYKKGEDVLIDILLLSKCNHILKCAAAVGECALWFNKSLECTDFSLESCFDKKDLHLLTSAYIKLNIGKSSKFFWILSLIKERIRIERHRLVYLKRDLTIYGKELYRKSLDTKFLGYLSNLYKKFGIRF